MNSTLYPISHSALCWAECNSSVSLAKDKILSTFYVKIWNHGAVICQQKTTILTGVQMKREQFVPTKELFLFAKHEDLNAVNFSICKTWRFMWNSDLIQFGA